MKTITNRQENEHCFDKKTTHCGMKPYRSRKCCTIVKGVSLKYYLAIQSQKALSAGLGQLLT